MSDSGNYSESTREWWEQTWSERESLLRSVFGVTAPPDAVAAFSWDRIDMVIPGACALKFPPKQPERPHWLCLSHGLTQPLVPGLSGSEQSAYGWEFAVITPEQADWASEVLYELLSFWMKTKNRLDVGHRVPMAFYRAADGRVRPQLRDLDPADPYPPEGAMRALVLWPYFQYPGRFATSTGGFGVLVGTTITEREWQLARSTSSAHLLLLLLEAGVGQLSDLTRQRVTNQPEFNSTWARICSLSQDDAEQLLWERTTS